MVRLDENYCFFDNEPFIFRNLDSCTRLAKLVIPFNQIEDFVNEIDTDYVREYYERFLINYCPN